MHTSPARALLPVSIQTSQIPTSALLCSQELLGDLIQRISALVCDPQVSTEASHPPHVACAAHACVTPTLTRIGSMPPKKKASFTRRKGVHAERPQARDGNQGAASKKHARTRSAGPPAPPVPAAGKRERAPRAAVPSHGLGDVLSAAMAQDVQRKQQREAAAAARAQRAEQRFCSPKPSARTAGSGGGSMEVSPTGGSGTSGSPSSPDRKKSRPSNQGEEEEEEEREVEEEGEQQQPSFEDSSDEEGAHKPPTPPPPTPPPKQPPLAAPRPKLASTVAAMAQTAGGASPTTDESPRVRPMVLRGDDQPAPHGRRQLLNRLVTPEER